MKLTYFLLFIFFLLSSCAAPPSSNSTRDYVADNDDPVIIINPEPDATPDTPSAEIKLAVKVGDDLYLSTMNEMFLASTGTTGNINRIQSQAFQIDNNLIQFDKDGQETSSLTLSFTPSVISQTDAGLFYIKEIPPDEALAMGGLYRTYSEIYRDHVVISPWYLNEWKCDNIISAGSEVYALAGSTYHQLYGMYSDIVYIEPGAFVMHSWDSINSRINFNSNIETFATNNILNARNWQEYDGLYYSENGFTWSESDGLSEAVTALWDFTSSPYPVDLPQGQAPVLLGVGAVGGALYWIECNSGWLFEYLSETDTLIKLWRLYDGDGMHSTGIAFRNDLKPVMVEDDAGEGVLFFSNDGCIYTLEITTGFINIFYSGNGEAIKW